MMSHGLFNEEVQILLLSMVPGLPLLLGCILLIRPLQKVGIRLAPWSALPALGAALFLEPSLNLEVGWFFMGGRMGLDLLGQRFLLLAALVWSLSAFFGRAYLHDDPRRASFFFFYLISMAFNFGLILAQDMLGFYLFFGLMSFSAYGLIVHKRSKEARQAGRVYIALVMVGEVLLVCGMLLMAAHLPDLELTTIAASRAGTLSLLLLFVGFGIKAGALPLHFWLPLAHPVAPVPASAVLSGVMIKAGLLGWLRFLPVGQDIFLPGWGPAFVVLGVLAAFYGVVIGLMQQEAKTVLAYSSISQMGLMTIVVGCGLLAPALWPQVINAVSIYAIHHGMAKATLFLATGFMGKGGRPTTAPWLMGLVLLPSLALAGLPLTSGAIAKFALKEIVHNLPQPWAGGLGVVLPLAAFATMLLLAHFLRIFSASLAIGGPPRKASIVSPLLIMLGVAATLLWVWPGRPEYAGHLLEVNLLWQGLWPVALAGCVMFFVWKWRLSPKGVLVPAGDILWVFYGPAKEFFGLLERVTTAQEVESITALFRHFASLLAPKDKGRGMEKRFMRWRMVGGCFLLVCLVILFVLRGN